MRYFLDTEFAETGGRECSTIDLISIGIVAEDGREFYEESSEFNLQNCNKWVMENVITQLGPQEKRIPRKEIADRILRFINNDPEPEFWAYFASYDWVVLCWLWGDMISLPKHFPMFCMDLQQWWVQLGRPGAAKPRGPKGEHNALADAHWNRSFHACLEAYVEGRKHRPS